MALRGGPSAVGLSTVAIDIREVSQYKEVARLPLSERKVNAPLHLRVFGAVCTANRNISRREMGAYFPTPPVLPEGLPSLSPIPHE